MMKPNVIARPLFALSLLTWSCQAYKPIEKATIPYDPVLTKIDNLSRQLALLEEGDQISIFLVNDVSHDLIFLAVQGDTLSAKLPKPKSSAPMKIPLNRVKNVKVEQVDTVMTVVMSAAAAGLVALLIYGALSNVRIL